jgi:Tfp pilus assembly protein PilF
VLLRAFVPAALITLLAAAGDTEPPSAPPFPITTGAAPGYVPDALCGRCHSELAQAFREVGMGRSFFRPRPADRIEDLTGARVVHEPSGQVLEMAEQGDRLVFRRYQQAADGQPIHLLELPVDWVLGSGNHARTYLYRTPGGELYQLPLAWYSQEGRWGMAPGFDRPDHDGVTRRVRRECMFCHNAYPEVPAGSDAYDQPPWFPEELPEGIGCQRCHGPGAAHVDRALGGLAPLAEVRSTIVNPGRLAPELRDDVCNGCHLQPSVALPGVRRVSRGDYSFRPGEPLADYLVQVDVEEEDRRREDRFEINHHAFRLRQSRCFTATAGKLSCLTCHDPHRKVAPARRRDHYRAACLSCHREAECGLAHGGPEPAVDRGDCVSCHMPQRRPTDVVHVIMTDHRIGRRPAVPDPLAPLPETDPVLTGVSLLEPQRVPPGDEGEIYRALAVVRTGVSPAAVEHLGKLLAGRPIPPPTVLLDLISAQLRLRQPARALATSERFLAAHPGHPLAREWRALALAGLGRTREAVAALEELLPAAPDRPELRFNLGGLLLAAGRPAAALSQLEAAVALRPNLAAAHFHRGNAHAALEAWAPAAEAYRKALALDPTHTDAYRGLTRALAASGQGALALRYLRHGLRAAHRPEQLEELEAELAKQHPDSPSP